MRRSHPRLTVEIWQLNGQHAPLILPESQAFHLEGRLTHYGRLILFLDTRLSEQEVPSVQVLLADFGRCAAGVLGFFLLLRFKANLLLAPFRSKL